MKVLIRVPFLMQWNEKIPAGKVYNGLTSGYDIFATAIKAAGLESKNKLDGVDLMPHLTGKLNTAPHKTLFWKKLNFGSIRHGDWKLINVEEYGMALYNVVEDISEKNNLLKYDARKKLKNCSVNMISGVPN